MKKRTPVPAYICCFLAGAINSYFFAFIPKHPVPLKLQVQYKEFLRAYMLLLSLSNKLELFVSHSITPYIDRVSWPLFSGCHALTFCGFLKTWTGKIIKFLLFFGLIQLVLLPRIQKALIFKNWSSIWKVNPKILLGYCFKK